MAAPLVPIAIAAARLAAKKLAGKATKKVVSKSVKKTAAAKKQAAVRQETVRIAKNSVKVKNPAKTKAAEKDIMTVIKKRAIRNEQIFAKGKPGFSMGKTKLIRQMKASNKNKSNAAVQPNQLAPKITNKELKKMLKNLKPMEDVPKGVSARFAETNARMAREAAKKKK